MSSATAISNSKSGQTARSFGVVTLLLLCVTLFGYVRDAILADRFGTSATMDAYVAAFFVPNLIYLVLITGALAPVFIPLFLEYRSRDSAEAFRVFSVVINFSAAALVIVVGVASCTARFWLHTLFSGFTQTELALALKLFYIIAPSIVFLGMGGVIAALLNGLNRFAVPSIAPITYSLSVIVTLAFAHGSNAIYWAAAATTLGLAAQFFVQLPAATRSGLHYEFMFDYRHPALKRVLRMAIPLLIYLLVAQGSVLLERNLASKVSVGAVSGFNYATRLFAIPFNLLAAPLAIVSLPEFSTEAAKPLLGKLRSKLLSALRVTTFIFVPISVWMVLQSLPLTRWVLERGHFSVADSHVTAGVLSLYSLGILPNAVAVILLRAFYALQDTITPLWIESINFLFYLSTAPYMARHYGLEGLALTRVISFFVVAGVLFRMMNKRLAIVDFRVENLFVLQVILGSTAFGIVSWAVFRFLGNVFEVHRFWIRFLVIALDCVLSAIVYLGISHSWAIPEASMLFRNFKTVWRRQRLTAQNVLPEGAR